MNPSRRGQPGILYWAVVALVFIVCTGAILYLCLLGAQTRLTGDDYCYNAVLVQEGFWGMQTQSYTKISMYNGNRFSLTFVSGLLGHLPTLGTPFIITFGLLAWLGGMTLLVKKSTRALNRNFSFVECVLVAEVFISFVLRSAPNLAQSLFWRSGMIPYFLPLVGGAWLIVIFWIFASRTKQAWYEWLLLFLLAFILAGFSETAAVVQFGFWLLLLVFLLISRQPVGFSKSKSWTLIFCVLLGTLTSLGFLYFSPSTALRRASMAAPLPFGQLIRLMATNVKVYFYFILKYRILQFVLPVAFGVGVGLLGLSRPAGVNSSNFGMTWKNLIFAGLALAFATLFLTACVLLPATYIFSDYPPERALILSQAVVIGAGILAGLWLALGLDRLIKKGVVIKKVYLVVSVVFLLSSLWAPVKLIQIASGEFPRFSKWARFWDVRHETLLNAGKRNEKVVHVDELDSLIRDVGELSPDPDYWYNNCAEMYYGVDAIYADLGGWDQ